MKGRAGILRQWTTTSILLIALSSIAIPGTGSAAATPRFARQVGYFKATLDPAPWSYTLQCVADDPSITGMHAIARGRVHPDYPNSLFGGLLYTPRHSSHGSYVQVGDEKVVESAPREAEEFNNGSTFVASGSSTGSTGGVAYVAWAMWGSPATCTGIINDVERPVTYLDGSYAFLVGPEAFGTGVLVQDGRTTASLARTYTTSLPGGVTFASFNMGSGGYGQFRFNTDPPTFLRECREPFGGGTCDATTPAATRLDVTIAASYDTLGIHGEMVVIALPRGA